MKRRTAVSMIFPLSLGGCLRLPEGENPDTGTETSSGGPEADSSESPSGSNSEDDSSSGSDTEDGSSEENTDGVPPRIGEYLSDAQLYEGTITDYTGQDEVTVSVGAGNGLAFNPAAIRIDSSTTVVWEWTGEGGLHNVASTGTSESDFSSGEAVGEEGHTFEQSFDNTGIQLYECTPHAAVGMLGAIEVVE